MLVDPFSTTGESAEEFFFLLSEYLILRKIFHSTWIKALDI